MAFPWSPFRLPKEGEPLDQKRAFFFSPYIVTLRLTMVSQYRTNPLIMVPDAPTGYDGQLKGVVFFWPSAQG